MDCLPHIHLAAYHDKSGYNNDTRGLGVLCVLSPLFTLAAGRYQNSINQDSDYAAVAYQPWAIGAAKVGAFGGVVSGYRAGTVPFAGALMSIKLTPGLSAHWIAIPAIGNYSAGVVQVSVSFDFK